MKLVSDKSSDIFNAGIEIFGSKGYKEANVADIAQLAGIGVGTFYNYFSSKEELFVRIYIKENEELKKRLVDEINFSDDPVTLVTKMLIKNIQYMNSNPILREWYNKELFGKLEKQFYQQSGFESLDDFLNSGRVQLIRQWKAEGKIRRDIDDDMINAIFSAILYIDIHKDEIGIQYFPQIMLHITEFIMKGLTASP